MLVEYWWNKSIEKYQFKAWFKEENAWLGLTNRTIEGGLEQMQQRWPNEEFELEEKKAA